MSGMSGLDDEQPASRSAVPGGTLSQLGLVMNNALAAGRYGGSATHIGG